MRKAVSILLAIGIIVILLVGVNELPKFGRPHNPSDNYVEHRYVEKGVEETGALNIVTGIILDYRALDTFVEATVLFTGAMTVLVVLKKDKDEMDRRKK